MNNNMDSKNMDSKNKEGIADKVGNLIEKVGHKISEAGAPKVGQKIHDLGDKLERDHSNVNHPHKV